MSTRSESAWAPSATRLLPGVNTRTVRGWMGLCSLAALLPSVALAELSNSSLIGVGLRSRPAYDGSAAQRSGLVPVIRHFGNVLFARSTQGVLEAGARTEIASGLHVGAQLAYEPGRQSSDAPFLEARQVADVGRGVSAGLHMEWDHSFGPMPVTLLARLRKHTRADLGLQADLRLSVGLFKGGRFGAGAFVQGAWADTRSTQALYGTTAQSSSSTGLPPFTAQGGRLNTSAGMLWSVDLSPSWVVVGSVEARRLQGSAARSPLVERTSGHSLSVGLARQF